MYQNIAEYLLVFSYAKSQYLYKMYYYCVYLHESIIYIFTRGVKGNGIKCKVILAKMQSA